MQVFFVISGFVLSIRALTLIRAGRHHAALDAVSTGAFRRFFRLYLPIAAVTLLTAALRRCTLIPWTTTVAPLPPWFDTPAEQFWDWLGEFMTFGNPLPIGCGTSRLDQCPAMGGYNSPVWTIPIEFRYSMVVFLSLLALARVRSW